MKYIFKYLLLNASILGGDREDADDHVKAAYKRTSVLFKVVLFSLCSLLDQKELVFGILIVLAALQPKQEKSNHGIKE